MGRGKRWSISDIDYLNEHWGMSTLANISLKLRRTKIAIHLKAKRLNMGASTRADEYMTANQVAVLLKVDRHALTRWIINNNLKAIRKILLYEKSFWLIKHCDLCEWLKNNQGRFDSRKIFLYSLGHEPEWLQKKRKRDKELPKKRFKKWTSLEVQRLIILSEDKKYREIAQLMDRSYSSIDHKMCRLKYRRKILGVLNE